MKHIITLTSLFFFFTSISAQSLELRPLAFYTFRETFPSQFGTLRIQDGLTFGGELGYVLDDRVDIYFSYQRMNAQLDLKRFPSQAGDIGNPLALNHFQLGLNRLHQVMDDNKILPYTGFKAGIGYYSLTETTLEPQVRLTIGLNAGVKLMVTEKIGFNIAGQLQSPISGLGLVVGAGSGGVSSGVGAYSYVLQFSVGGGLIYKIN
jgi:hypothetical protein